jgi:hypothetical protein
MKQAVEPWLVRIEDAQAGTYGAGTLLDEDHVLTCTHVVESIDTDVFVRVRGRSEKAHAAEVVTRVTADHQQTRGDVAILRLAEAATGAPRARLRRVWSEGDTVRCFGFGDGLEDQGVTADAVIKGYDMHGERVQLDAMSETRITEGFSGAAALNAAGEVCGMIVSVVRGSHNVSWMIDIKAVKRHAPMTQPYLIVDEPSSDPRFTDPRSQPGGPPRDAPHVALERALVDWLGSDDTGGVAVVCGEPAMAVVSRLVGLTVSAYRARVSEAERDAGLPLGSVDAAVDAESRTADEVAAAIIEAIGLRSDDGLGLLEALEALGPPVIVVVNSVDAADDPADLCERVLRPIAVRAPLLRVRLLLGFDGTPPGDLAEAVVIEP